MDYLWLIVSWIIYFILHSVLALSAVKNFFHSLSIYPQAYRLIFNILAIVLLVPIFLISSNADSGYLFKPAAISKFGGLVFATWGIIVIKLTFKSYHLKAFLGLANLNEEDTFKKDGLLKSVRHPLYSGSILVILGYLIFDPKITTLISAALLVLYIFVGIQFEEKKLIRKFGDAYIDYRNKTPMLIPKLAKKE